MKNVLITGGAGFIGSHLAEELLRHGYRVRVLDNLSPQVHGDSRRRPDYLHPEVELIPEDIRNDQAVRAAMRGIDAVFHFVAVVGVGQSMYELTRYTSVNNVGTAVLLEVLSEHQIEKLIVASSMSVYGEGIYRDSLGRIYSNVERSLEQLRAGDWEMRNAEGERLQPLPTPEDKIPALPSLYALTKYDQERMCHLIGRAYRIPTVALRFFNVFGPHQALSNPYTGVLAIFASRLLNGNAPVVFEDGRQLRDFVNVYDVARACRLALESPDAAGMTFNIGSGRQYTIRSIAEKMARVLGKPIDPEITGNYRFGDVRHCFPDIGLARQVLGYEPCVSLEDGLVELATWLEGQVACDRVGEARAELASRGLMV